MSRRLATAFEGHGGLQRPSGAPGPTPPRPGRCRRRGRGLAHTDLGRRSRAGRGTSAYPMLVKTYKILPVFSCTEFWSYTCVCSKRTRLHAERNRIAARRPSAARRRRQVSATAPPPASARAGEPQPRLHASVKGRGSQKLSFKRGRVRIRGHRAHICSVRPSTHPGGGRQSHRQ